jgi:hypothetical protein
MAESIRALVHQVIDYAGLFPPAGLDMPSAVANYARYKASPESWMLARFVVPASRLPEFGRAESAVARDASLQTPWRISVIAGDDPAAAIESIANFQRTSDCATIDAIEINIDSPGRIGEFISRIPASMAPYFEIPLTPDPQRSIEALAACGGRAKMRTGGITQDMIPHASDIARFIIQCAGLGVPFKATAGLHHALRGSHPLTYEPQSAHARMHGFLNVFTAACFAYAGLTEHDNLVALLEQESAKDLRFDDTGVIWGEWRIAVEQIRNARANLAIAFGSCSFEEPLAGLRALGLL